jgi:hypothetical protein
MTKRPRLPLAALGLLASLTVAPPSQAGSFAVNVQQGFGVNNTSYMNTIQTITFNFTGLDGIFSPSIDGTTGVDITGLAPTYVATVIPTISVPSQPPSKQNPPSVQLDYTSAPSGAVYLTSGSISFTTLTDTSDVSQLANLITLAGVDIVEPSSSYSTNFGPLHFTVLGQVIPEPSSVVLLGIGMAGCLAVRLGRAAKRVARLRRGSAVRTSWG